MDHCGRVGNFLPLPLCYLYYCLSFPPPPSQGVPQKKSGPVWCMPKVVICPQVGHITHYLRAQGSATPHEDQMHGAGAAAKSTGSSWSDAAPGSAPLWQVPGP